MNISRTKVSAPRPPDKGSFPLDHDSECASIIHRYLKCLDKYDQTTKYCAHISKEYFKCRMEKGLMAYDEELLNSLPDQPLMDME